LMLIRFPPSVAILSMIFIEFIRNWRILNGMDYLVPQSVQCIGASDPSCSVEGRSNCMVEADFIIVSSGAKLVRCCGGNDTVAIPFSVEILCSSCFGADCFPRFQLNGSQLNCIESKPFSHSSIKSITIH
jgi:hypothetical protein